MLLAFVEIYIANIKYNRIGTTVKTYINVNIRWSFPHIMLTNCLQCTVFVNIQWYFVVDNNKMCGIVIYIQYFLIFTLILINNFLSYNLCFNLCLRITRLFVF